MEQAVERAGVVRRGDRVVAACSGGSDSVALAALLHSIRTPLRLELTLAHVNHGLRPSAGQDEAVTMRVAAALALPLHVRTLHGTTRDEASLREARYAALAEIAAESGANAVATGHNAEDQTETVLLALFRGTGPEGLAGMPATRQLADGIELRRPLLRFERAALRSYVQQAGLPFAVDPTNADPAYRRNAVRQALRALRPLFPGLDGAVSRAAELVGDELDGTPAAALRRHVREALRENEALAGVDFEHVEAAVRALQSGGSGRFDMVAGVELAIENGGLTVHRK